MLYVCCVWYNSGVGICCYLFHLRVHFSFEIKLSYTSDEEWDAFEVTEASKLFWTNCLFRQLYGHYMDGKYCRSYCLLLTYSYLCPLKFRQHKRIVEMYGSAGQEGWRSGLLDNFFGCQRVMVCKLCNRTRRTHFIHRLMRGWTIVWGGSAFLAANIVRSGAYQPARTRFRVTLCLINMILLTDLVVCTVHQWAYGTNFTNI